ncbi:hypothetical protein B296_00005566 [Ensete ventricosum]|uniref:Uncharacterized protein n=1 Tax=Ensete ventricosum TaxID=4639 RepID=A0A426Z028_ENSVE|nr:hypothetical protein B296_00005566 [Ensete ventricosum]
MRVAEACPRVRWRAYRYSFSLPSLLAAMAFWGGDAGRAMEVEHLHASRGLRRARTPTNRAAALMHALRASLLSCRSGVSSNPPALALQPPFDGYVLSVGYEAGAQRPYLVTKKSPKKNHNLPGIDPFPGPSAAPIRTAYAGEQRTVLQLTLSELNPHKSTT